VLIIVLSLESMNYYHSGGTFTRVTSPQKRMTGDESLLYLSRTFAACASPWKRKILPARGDGARLVLRHKAWVETGLSPHGMGLMSITSAMQMSKTSRILSRPEIRTQWEVAKGCGAVGNRKIHFIWP
jgi:hypothetical protein